MFLSCHSNYKNIARIAHSHCKKITRKSILEHTLDYDEYLTRASRSNTGTPKSMANVVFSPTPGIFGMHSSQLPAGFSDQNAEEGPVIVDMDKGTVQINKYVEGSPMPAWMKSRIRHELMKVCGQST